MLVCLIYKSIFPSDIGVIFEPFIVDQKETCAKFLIARYGHNTGRMTCQERCRFNDECKFYLFGKDFTCDLYSACNVTRTIAKPGTTFKKKGKISFIVESFLFDTILIV